MQTHTLPNELEYQGEKFVLTIDNTADGKTVLTYEHDPIKEDSFLIGVINDTLERAVNSMIEKFSQFNMINSTILPS